MAAQQESARAVGHRWSRRHLRSRQLPRPLLQPRMIGLESYSACENRTHRSKSASAHTGHHDPSRQRAPYVNATAQECLLHASSGRVRTAQTATWTRTAKSSPSTHSQSDRPCRPMALAPRPGPRYVHETHERHARIHCPRYSRAHAPPHRSHRWPALASPRLAHKTDSECPIHSRHP